MTKQAETYPAIGRAACFLVSFPLNPSYGNCEAKFSKNFKRNRDAMRAFRSRCQPHRKRESAHHVIGCGVPRIRLRSRWHTTSTLTFDDCHYGVLAIYSLEEQSVQSVLCCETGSCFRSARNRRANRFVFVLRQTFRIPIAEPIATLAPSTISRAAVTGSKTAP